MGHEPFKICCEIIEDYVVFRFSEDQSGTPSYTLVDWFEGHSTGLASKASYIENVRKE